MNRTTAAWFGAAGVLSLFTWVIFTIAEPTYYAAASVTDHLSVVGLSTALVVTGVALISLWRDPPLRRGSSFILLAGIGAVAEGLGNLFEDTFGVEAAVWAFFGGGILLIVGLFAAGIAALTVPSPRRWAGLFLLFAVPGGMLGFGGVMMGTAWILLALWIVSERRAVVIAQAVAVIPAVAIAVDLYWSDVAG